jgi:hypothetical protein
MNTTRDPDTILAAWLDEGPTNLPDATRRAILTALPTTSQARRGPFAPWRLFQMTSTARLAAVALVAVVAVGGAWYLFGPSRYGSSGNVPTPTLTPSTAAPSSQPTVPTPTLPTDTSSWIQFPSLIYDYSFARPSGWTLGPAAKAWAGQTSSEVWHAPADAPWVDFAYDSVSGLVMTAVETTVPAGMTDEAFIDSYMTPSAGATPTSRCRELAASMSSIVIDGHQGRITTKCDDLAAFVAIGNRLFVFAISDTHQLAFMNAYLSTIKFHVGAPTPT